MKEPMANLLRRRSSASRTVLLAVVLAMLLSCVDRKRDNPFDPNGESDPPVSLSLKPDADFVELHWQLTRTVTEFQGFRIYRGVDSLQALAPFIDLPPGQRSFTDTGVQSGHWYFYKVTLRAGSEESIPSPTLKTYPGPGRYWVMSRQGFYLKQLSYDLIYTFHDYPTLQGPEEWAVNSNDTLIWLVYTRFDKGVSSFDKRNGRETPTYLSFLNRPIDVARSPAGPDLFILDSTAHAVFIFREGQIRQEIPLDSTESYYKIEIDAARQQLLVLGSRQMEITPQSPGGAAAVIMAFPPGFRGKDFDLVNGRAYILAASEPDNSSLIMTLDLNSLSIDQLNVTGSFYRIRFDPATGVFYVAEALPQSQDQVVQLSTAGDRQFQLSGFESVEDIAVNAIDHSVVVIDNPGNFINLYDQTGRLISTSRDNRGSRFIVRPLRIFIE